MRNNKRSMVCIIRSPKKRGKGGEAERTFEKLMAGKPTVLKIPASRFKKLSNLPKG